ncbi:hypothetical protein RHECNPAF_28002 [Rhizobium etli CNPAF512]|nr:hypothetical protein RHECNPAF_28002 [Rhizobium etli CNPAF512]
MEDRVEHIASCVFGIEFGKRGSSSARHKARLILSDRSNAAGPDAMLRQPVSIAPGEDGRCAGNDAKPFACDAPALGVKMTREHQKTALASTGEALPAPPTFPIAPISTEVSHAHRRRWHSYRVQHIQSRSERGEGFSGVARRGAAGVALLCLPQRL